MKRTWRTSITAAPHSRLARGASTARCVARRSRRCVGRSRRRRPHRRRPSRVSPRARSPPPTSRSVAPSRDGFRPSRLTRRRLAASSRRAPPSLRAKATGTEADGARAAAADATTPRRAGARSPSSASPARRRARPSASPLLWRRTTTTSRTRARAPPRKPLPERRALLLPARDTNPAPSVPPTSPRRVATTEPAAGSVPVSVRTRIAVAIRDLDPPTPPDRDPHLRPEARGRRRRGNHHL